MSNTQSSGRFFVTKRGLLPYSGPTVGRAGIPAKWFDTFHDASSYANLLSLYNGVGFHVEEIKEGYHAGEYPRFEKDA